MDSRGLWVFLTKTAVIIFIVISFLLGDFDTKKKTPDGYFLQGSLQGFFIFMLYSSTLLGSSNPYPEVLSSCFNKNANKTPKSPRAASIMVGLV